MSCGIHQNDIGTTLQVTIVNCNSVAVDISSADALQIVLKKPGGTAVTKTASFYTDGSDGIITYTIVSGDLDEVGTWKLQAVVTIGTNVWHSEFESFRVYRNLA